MESGGQPEYRLPQLAVFDIDGTITAPRSTTIPQEIIDGFKHLRHNGVITTICTGRPFIRMKEALGEKRAESANRFVPTFFDFAMFTLVSASSAFVIVFELAQLFLIGFILFLNQREAW